MTARIEKDSMGEINVPNDKLWGAQTQRSLHYFSIGDDLMPRELVGAFAIIKKAAARVNEKRGLLSNQEAHLIATVCDEILEDKWSDQFPLHVWMTGSGTQFNMNINEVIANRASQLMDQPLGSKRPIHPNDHVNMSQSSNDTFPTAMHLAAAIGVKNRLIPALSLLKDALEKKSIDWMEIVKIGRTHLQDATPMTLGQEFSGYVGLLADGLHWLENSLEYVYRLALGGTAIGTGVNAPLGFDRDVAAQIAELTHLPFVTAPNKFSVQGSHDALVQLSGTLKTVATSLYKISQDITLLSCGPRCGLGELILPENEPGSSIMPGKVNPTQCEALAMLSLQVIANDLAVSLGGGGGTLEMNVFKPLIIKNLLQSIRLLTDGANHFRQFLIEGTRPNEQQLDYFVQRSLMLVTALSPLVGYDKCSKIAQYALKHDLTLKEAAESLGFVTPQEFDTWVDSRKMTGLPCEK